MIYTATNNKTGEKTEFTEAQVKAEIIDTLQHDMSTVMEYSDDEIDSGVKESDTADYFFNGEFDGFNYSITAN